MLLVEVRHPYQLDNLDKARAIRGQSIPVGSTQNLRSSSKDEQGMSGTAAIGRAWIVFEPTGDALPTQKALNER